MVSHLVVEISTLLVKGFPTNGQVHKMLSPSNKSSNCGCVTEEFSDWLLHALQLLQEWSRLTCKHRTNV